jgi:hypothetical protein
MVCRVSERASIPLQHRPCRVISDFSKGLKGLSMGGEIWQGHVTLVYCNLAASKTQESSLIVAKSL